MFWPSIHQVDEPDKGRPAFQRRYGHFQTLLTANNNALQAMAELEKMYYSAESYRMADIRSRITAILVNVYKMIRSLSAMAPGKYDELAILFEQISMELDRIVERRPIHCDGPLTLALSAINQADRQAVGDKMANLGEASSLAGIQVPAGFVVTASATRRFLSPALITEINRHLQLIDADNLPEFYRLCTSMQQLVMTAPMVAEVERELFAGYRQLEESAGRGCKVALRSSALGEDAAGVSFAGLYGTVLDVDRATLLTAYRQVVASKYGARAIAYRRKRGYRHEDIEMCVGCLVMVPALISGVTYSRDPVTAGGDVVRINATRGVGKGVVDGTRQVEQYLLGREKPFPLLYSELRSGGAGNGGGERAGGLLNYPQLKQLAEMALVLENHFGAPQDIEWSFDHLGKVFLLQSRPMLMERVVRPPEEAAAPGASDIAEPLVIDGVTASDGVACGAVWRLPDGEVAPSMPKGRVLVVEYPLPDYAPLVERAAAVIAEYGSEAGHLATVAREFGIPALFGVRGVLTLLPQEMTITLNSSQRAIYAGRCEQILKTARVRREPMAGSPVQRIMSEALQLITPLNLSDPASSRFKPSWCETLHDITRYCHEKSVGEMFRFSSRDTLGGRSAKHLTGGVPLAWSVINLADGFAADYDDSAPNIAINQIVSQPMLAICRGLTAVPWEGPPPVSARGFGAIIFQSTMRPDLDPAVASPLAAKNYFLISRHFCNVSVRLGYHYAMIEAYIGELLSESYVTFRFKGGAADMRRKAVRARLLADVLKRFGFRVELHSDSLLARVKKRPASFLEERLQILGYLILHARQLDMVMNQPQAVERYRQRFIEDISTMVGPAETGGEGDDEGAAGR